MRARIEEALCALRRGELVAFPTETVYGLGADAERPEAIARVFAAKGRPADHPLIVHLPDAGLLTRYAEAPPAEAFALAEALWPGPLTLVLRRSPRVLEAVSGGLPTVGLRVPEHPLALALLRAFGRGIAAPSANRFGALSPTRAEDVREELGGEVAVILDGGPCEVGLESSIVDLSAVDRGGPPRLLRPGGIPRERLEAILGRPLEAAEPGGARAPGMLPSHYAPRAELRVVSEPELLPLAARLASEGRKIGVLGPPGSALPAGALPIPLPTTLEGQAQALYAALREGDRRGCELLLIALPEAHGLGEALRDRLHRAAAPRPETETETGAEPGTRQARGGEP